MNKREVEHEGTIVGYDGDDHIILQEGDKQVRLWIGMDVYVEGFEDGVDEEGYPPGAAVRWVTYE